MKIIKAFDRGTVSILEPRANSVLIMITSKDNEFPKIDSKWTEVLKLKFDDVEGRTNEIGHTSNVLSIEQAYKILDFAIENINCDIFVSCDAGLSRSPGVVVALEQIFNGNDVSDRYPHYNRFVKNRIKDVWFNTIWKGLELKEDE